MKEGWINVGLGNKVALVITILVCSLANFPKVKRMINNFCLTQKFISLLNIIEQKYYKHMVVLIVFLGAVPRLWKFGIIPAGFNQDGAMGAVDALALAQYGTDRFGMWMPVHFTAWGFGQMSVLLSYLSVPFIKIFGLNRFTARVPVLMVSLLALLVMYKLCKNIFDRKTAITVLAFGY